VCGHVDELRAHEGDYVPVSAFPVAGEAVRRGRRVPPWAVGLGLSMTVRRDVIERLGGWDERLGAGTRPFPAAEDMDFNYRLLRSGAAVLSTNRVRAVHHQWRDPAELPALYGNYMAGWCGFAMKHARGGDVAGGLWLWADGVRDAARMAASGVRRRSPLRRAIARQKLGGLVGGTLRGLRTAW
jgi:GT2 family glycosyltransferase